MNVAAAQRSGAVTVLHTSKTVAASPILTGPAPAPTPGVPQTVPETGEPSVPDAGVDPVPSPSTPGGDRLGQSVETLAKTVTNGSSVDLDAGPDVPTIRPASDHSDSAVTTPSVGDSVVQAVAVTGAQDTRDVEMALPRDSVAKPTTPAQSVVVATSPTPTKTQTPDAPLHPIQAAERVSPGDGNSSSWLAPAATASAAEPDAGTPDTVLDAKTGLVRLFGRGGPLTARNQQSVTVVGARETMPIMVDLPGVDGASAHPVLSLPASIVADTVAAEHVSVSIGIGPAEAWRYEEVARLLEDSGHAARQSRAFAAASAVMPLEALSEWTGSAVRSSFAPPALSEQEQLELPDQLVRAIRMQWRNGVGDAKLRLTPEHLGEVLVSLQVRQGSVSAVLRVDSEIVRDWIRAHQHELKSSLEVQGLQLDELVVEEDGHADQQPGREFDHPRRRLPRQTSEARFEVRV